MHGGHGKNRRLLGWQIPETFRPVAYDRSVVLKLPMLGDFDRSELADEFHHMIVCELNRTDRPN